MAFFNARLRRLFRKGELSMPRRMAHVVTPADLDRWLAPVLRKSWCVDVQGAPPEYRGPDAILNYLAGYVVGTAIHDHRILRYDRHCVVIGWKNYRTGKFEELPMTGEEFVRRFADHILPPRFVRIRYAGLFCARYRKGWLARCHELLGTTIAKKATTEEAVAEASSPEPVGNEEPPKSQPRYQPTCGRCGQPEMTSRGNLTARETAYHILWLRLFCDRLFTWLSTMDIDPSTIGLTSMSLDCVPDFVILSYGTTWDHDIWPDLPLPHT